MPRLVSSNTERLSMVFILYANDPLTIFRSLLRQHFGVQLAVMISYKHHLRGVGARTACKGTLITVSLSCVII